MILNTFYKFWAWLLGVNLASTPVNVIQDQMHELRPLPVGVAEFDAWADRIIAGCLLTADPSDPEAVAKLRESQRFTLCGMILHLGPTESHKEDAFFIHSLRKAAANQIAHAKMMELKKLSDERLAQMEATSKIINGVGNGKVN